VFDGRWLRQLGWFAGPDAPELTSKTLARFAEDEYGDDLGAAFEQLASILTGQLYLLPLGSDSRRALYVGESDGIGEHPVIVTDVDELPYVAIMYPGFDVYMADLTGVLSFPFETYEALHDHPEYGARLSEHAKMNLGGRRGIQLGEHLELEGGSPPAWQEGDALPDGYRAVVNPFTGQKSLVRA
jgi:hypothetical protein